jgi:hypothetical protein
MASSTSAGGRLTSCAAPRVSKARRTGRCAGPAGQVSGSFGDGRLSRVETDRTIRVETQDIFSPQLDRLRWEYADQEWPGGTSRDDFDNHSSHVTLSVGGELAGMVRVTRRPPSVLSAWAIGTHHLPNGGGIFEATRGVVARRWRGMSLYKLLMVEATRYCDRSGASLVVAVIDPDFPLRGFLEKIGYRGRGEPSRFYNHPKGEVWGQVIVQDPVQAREAASAALSSCVSGLHERGFSIHSTAHGAVMRKVQEQTWTRR